MTVLKLEDGSTEEHPDLLSLVKAHPEIAEAVLYYVEYGHKTEVVDDPTGCVLCYSVEYVDWEYSYVGVVDDLERFASNYDVWDDAALGLNKGVLLGHLDSWDENGERYPDHDYPETDRLGRFVLESIRLPSGVTVKVSKE